MGNKYKHLIPQNIAPLEATRVGIYNSNNQYVGSLPLGHLRQPQGDKKYSFCLVSDIHIGYDTAEDDFIRVLDYVEKSDCAFTVVNGDLTDWGTDERLLQYKGIVDSKATKPVYALAGNHETIQGYMTTERIKPYTGHDLCYFIEIGDDVFIFVGHYGKYWGDNVGWNNSEFVSGEELKWLYGVLEANRNKRCFLFNHVYPWDDGVGDASRFYNGTYWRTQDGGVGQAYHDLLLHYKNLTLFHGHSHLRYSLQEYDIKANYAEDVGYRSVHISSLAVPRDRIDGATSNIYAESEGYIVDVYDNYIVLNAMDFIDNGKDGMRIPLGTFRIDTTLRNVDAHTFVDSTGIIA